MFPISIFQQDNKNVYFGKVGIISIYSNILVSKKNQLILNHSVWITNSKTEKETIMIWQEMEKLADKIAP